MRPGREYGVILFVWGLIVLWQTREQIVTTTFKQIEGVVLSITPGDVAKAIPARVLVGYHHRNETYVQMFDEDQQKCNQKWCNYVVNGTVVLPFCRTTCGTREAIEQYDCREVKALHYTSWALAFILAALLFEWGILAFGQF